MNRHRIAGSLRALTPYLSLWLVCGALVGAAASYAVIADRERERSNAQKDSTNLTRLMQAQAMRTLDAIDHRLTLVRAVQEHRLTGSSPHGLFKTLRLGTDAQHRVSVFDREGRFVSSTDADRKLDLMVADRAYFRAARDANSDALIISTPLTGRVTGHTVLPAVRRVTSPSGEFDGIVMCPVDPARFIEAYRDINLGNGEFVGVAQRDGRIIATNAPAVEEPASAIAALPLGSDPAPVPIAWPVLDRATYLLATQPVPGSDLFVFVARPESDILAGNARFTNAVILLAGMALLALALPIGYTARRSLRVLREREALEARTRIDPLTQTNNRAALEDRAQHCLDGLAREGEPFALAYIDIDNFKALNDSRGHAEGDRALSRIAAILQASVRKTDVVARMGGDEFAVLLPAGGPPATRRVFDQVLHMLRGLALREDWPISFSIGVVTFQTPPHNASEAIAIADRVMYTVKQTTKNGMAFAAYDQHGLQLGVREAPPRSEPCADPALPGHAA